MFNLRGVNDARQTVMRTTEQVLPETSSFEFEVTNEKLKS